MMQNLELRQIYHLLQTLQIQFLAVKTVNQQLPIKLIQLVSIITKKKYFAPRQVPLLNLAPFFKLLLFDEGNITRNTLARPGDRQ